MIGFRKGKALVAALGGLALSAACAQAAPVVFNTAGSYFTPLSGSFSNGSLSGYVINSGPNATPGGTTTFLASDTKADANEVNTLGLAAAYAAGIPYVELQYTDMPVESLLQPNNWQFGQFSVSTDLTTAPSLNFLNGIQFILKVTQTAPYSAGPGSSTANVSGYIQLYNGGPDQTPSIAIDFVNPSFSFGPSAPFPAYNYSVDNVSITTNPSPNPAVAALDGTVAAAPLPATANMGLALFAGLAALGGYRRWAKIA